MCINIMNEVCFKMGKKAPTTDPRMRTADLMESRTTRYAEVESIFANMTGFYFLACFLMSLISHTHKKGLSSKITFQN